ncbi:hypothetical protein BTVI_14044 [Pitangus sulphuratus]|nr:hypothetical protein BTVI_14044 [Pitangus sulphuratus]
MEGLDYKKFSVGNIMVESLCVRIKRQTSSVDVIAGVCYSPPSQDDDASELFFNKRQCRNIIGLLEDEDGHFTDRNIDKAETFNAFFAPIFYTVDALRVFQCPGLGYYGCKNDKVPDNSYKSMGPGGIQVTTLKELSDHRIIESQNKGEGAKKQSCIAGPVLANRGLTGDMKIGGSLDFK